MLLVFFCFNIDTNKEMRWSMLLEVKHVKKVYGKGLNATTALNQMNLSVGAGEFVIMGESGQGSLHY